MSLSSEAFIFDRYGPRLNAEQLAEFMNIQPGTLRNRICAGTFPIKTYVHGGKRFADYRDVAAHLDECRELAR